MFSHVQPAPPDSIFGLNDQFLRDPHPHKINLTVGVYQDEHGRTPVVAAIKRAEARLLESETTKDYVSMDGWAEFNSGVAELVLGPKNPAYLAGRYTTLQTLGGTGALRLSADLLATTLGQVRIAHSAPTWPNHLGIFRAAGLEPQPYRYFDPRVNDLDFAGMRDDLRELPEGTPVLLHTVCHNPTGFDLELEQWEVLAELFESKRFIALFDFAYQGFDRSVDADREPIEMFCERNIPLLICSSFSKNMGLYGERVGACTVVAPNAAQAAALHSHLKLHARCSYSNPVRHGAQLAAAVLHDDQLRHDWLCELDRMREQIDEQRGLLLRHLRDKAPHMNFEFLGKQRGMFGFSGLNPDQARILREQYSIYMLGNGRINIAGIHPHNVERLVEAIAAVTSVPVPQQIR